MDQSMNTRRVMFIRPHTAAAVTMPMPIPDADQVLVASCVSAISAGTEMLVYQGGFPEGMRMDTTIPTLSGRFAYPLQYGYSCVGRIIATGAKVDPELTGRNVFAFHPHQGRFAVRPEELVQLPVTLALDDAVFFASMETALTLVLDGYPRIGEQVMVFGLGMIGLLATALLARFPLAHLACVDPIQSRREVAKQLGAHRVMSNHKRQNTHDDQKTTGAVLAPSGADLIYELSGNPNALNGALTFSGFNTRIVIGSWYGAKQVPLNLGGRFHRNRIQLMSSQVSTIAPGLTGRWSRQRRTQTVLHWLETLRPSRWITHRYPVTRVQEAYARIAAEPESTLQVVLEYP